MEWKYITSDTYDERDEGVTRLRPDLEWISPDFAQDGITQAMEERILGGVAIDERLEIPPQDPS